MYQFDGVDDYMILDNPQSLDHDENKSFAIQGTFSSSTIDDYDTLFNRSDGTRHITIDQRDS